MKKIIALSSFCFLTIIIVVLTQISNRKIMPDLSTCETPSKLRECPEKVGEVFLPRTYPARAIYVGFSNDGHHIDFLETLLDVVSGLDVKPVVNILIPRFESYEAYDHLRKYFNIERYNFINFIPTSSKDTVWAQDYLEILFDTDNVRSSIVDLPYFDREGEDIPTSIALACQKNLIPQAEFEVGKEPGNGDYGGNIEPITTKLLTVGNNISNETLEVLKKITSQKIIEIDVDWLETGHVDELVTTLPHKNNATACEQTLLVASPKLAMDIINKLPKNFPEQRNPNPPFFDDEITWPDNYHCLHPSNGSLAECEDLKRANTTYQVSINASTEAILSEVEKIHGCRLKYVEFPQLFLPLTSQNEYGTYDDRAVALNPNSVNNIFFYPNLLLAKQEFLPFQSVVEKVLSSMPYTTTFVDGKFVHELNGGIHCATNISYGCSN